MRELQEARSLKQIESRELKQSKRATIDLNTGVASKQLEKLSKSINKQLNQNN
jgi:hypothetical protein